MVNLYSFQQFYFVRNGVFNITNSTGIFRSAGDGGQNWSSRSGTITTAYYLEYWAFDVLPSNGPYDRWFGFPLRCLSTVLDI